MILNVGILNYYVFMSSLLYLKTETSLITELLYIYKSIIIAFYAF